MTRTSTINPAYARKGDLTKGPVGRHLVRLSLPMIWGIFAIISFQLVDTWYVSLLGTKPLAAMTFTFPVTYTIFSMTMGLTIAMSSVVSRTIGEGNQDRVRRITTHGLMIAVMLGLFLATAGFFFMNPLFRAMGAEDDLLPMIDDYMIIWFAGSVFVAMPMIGNAALRASGDTMMPAFIMTVAAVANIVLDPLLIFGLLGFPRLELQGAAIATVFANFCAMLAGLYILYFRRHMICRDGLHLNHFRDSLKRLAYIALPAGLTGTIQPLTNAVIISFLAGYGAETVAAFGVVTRMEAFAFTVIIALATGMSPIIGQNWGAKQFGRVHETLNKALAFAAGWSLLAGAVFMLFAEPLAGAFSRDSAPEFIAAVALYFHFVAPTYIPSNIVQGWGSAFNAMGMPKRSFVMIVVKNLALTIPLAWGGGHLFGLPGIFGAMAATNLLTGAWFHFRNRRICRASEQEATA